ncbi:MAG: oligopeptide/dipeptide ABC transporter ATP-binding protein, partial [Spirochaetota bacterium]
MNRKKHDSNGEAETLLSVKNLSLHFHIDEKTIKAVNGADFHIQTNEVFGLVGESGSGKSVSALSILRLLPSPPCKINGEIVFKGEDLQGLTEKQMRKIRGRDITMIFQEPMSSLNPVLTIGDQISESIWLHQNMNKKDAWKKAVEMLKLVRIPEPSRAAKKYPHELSGGMKQRAMIAMALATNPSLLIADEPTTALDVTIQKQILFLIKELRREFRTSVLFITHNLGVMAEIADRVAVMYAGKILECASVKEIFHKPLHPYTMCLLRSIPRIDYPRERKLEIIPGRVPDPGSMPSGCVFHPRCPMAVTECRGKEPPLFDLGGKHTSRCWRHAEIKSSKKKPIEIVSAVKKPENKHAGLLLSVKDLSRYFKVSFGGLSGRADYVRAVDGISFDLKKGEVLGLV